MVRRAGSRNTPRPRCSRICCQRRRRGARPGRFIVTEPFGPACAAGGLPWVRGAALATMRLGPALAAGGLPWVRGAALATMRLGPALAAGGLLGVRGAALAT